MPVLVTFHFLVRNKKKYLVILQLLLFFKGNLKLYKLLNLNKYYFLIIIYLQFKV